MALALGFFAGRAVAASPDLLHIPGMNFSSLPPAAQKELATVFEDEFCYCGCPHTVGQCLREHKSCAHARREASLAAALAATGMGASDISIELSRYYLGFREKKALPIDPRQCKGPKDAKLTLAEFSDFECPYCGAARPVLEKFAADHQEVRLCWMAFPLKQHPNAIPAGQAALFARDHGRFWQMHDLLFEHQTELSPEEIVMLGKEAGLDEKALEKVLHSEQYVDALKHSREQGIAAGVTGTPTISLDGHVFSMPIKPEYLAHALGDVLEWEAHGGAWAAD